MQGSSSLTVYQTAIVMEVTCKLRSITGWLPPLLKRETIPTPTQMDNARTPLFSFHKQRQKELSQLPLKTLLLWKPRLQNKFWVSQLKQTSVITRVASSTTLTALTVKLIMEHWSSAGALQAAPSTGSWKIHGVLAGVKMATCELRSLMGKESASFN